MKAAGSIDRMQSLAGMLLALLLCLPTVSVAQQDRSFDVAAAMGRGINILGYDGVWEGGVNAPFRMSNLSLIRDTGFHHVRINLVAFRFMDDRNQLDPAFLVRLDGVIEQVVANGLIPVIDEHDYDFCQKQPDRCAVKLKAFWQLLSQRYAGRFPKLVFEILNEPGGAMTPQNWNVLALDVLRIIRASNPDRTVIVAAINADDPAVLQQLRLPSDDRNLILTVHYYAPIAFTHQGAPWSQQFARHVGISWGSASDRKALTEYFETVDKWAKQKGRPVYLGEFGVFERAPPDARKQYIDVVSRTAERLGWPWAYWQFDHDFAAFDSEHQSWVKPVIEALFPGHSD